MATIYNLKISLEMITSVRHDFQEKPDVDTHGQGFNAQ